MTQPRARFRAARLTIQFAALGTLASVIVGGCSSDVKTVTVEDCPMGGASAGGHGPLTAGTHNGESGAASVPEETAGEAGIGQGGTSSGGESGSAGMSVPGYGGIAGDGAAAGRGGSSGSGGKSTTNGGSGNAGGHTGGSGGSGGASASGGAPPATCGDKAVTPPEFCDDGANTDLSYGCYACTTLPPASGGSSAPPQCEACLQSKSHPSSCYACKDYRACYACLRRQPDTFPSTSLFCSGSVPDDAAAEPDPSPQHLSDRCFDPSNTEYKTATGGPAGAAPRGLVCQELVECVLRTGCAAGINPTTKKQRTMFADCWCGSGDCGNPSFVPHGPCVNEMRNADAPAATTTGSALTIELSTHLADPDPGNPWSPLGLAYAITGCASDPLGCADVCFPDSGSAGGTGGASNTAGTAGH
jgi:hypothetical protein